MVQSDLKELPRSANAGVLSPYAEALTDARRFAVLLTGGKAPDLSEARSVRVPHVAGEGGVRQALSVPCPAAHGGHECLPSIEGPVPRAAVREACESADDDGVYASE